jgi:hypothetical protein
MGCKPEGKSSTINNSEELYSYLQIFHKILLSFILSVENYMTILLNYEDTVKEYTVTKCKKCIRLIKIYIVPFS